MTKISQGARHEALFSEMLTVRFNLTGTRRIALGQVL